MIDAVIFDMDGLLIDSEAFWQEEERKLFARYGIHITPEMQKDTYGLGTNEVIEYWYNYQPWDHFDLQEIKNELFDAVEERIDREAEPLPGVNETIDFFKSRNTRPALASASPFGIIDTVLNKLQLKDFFKVVHSCELEEFGKPHPAVYISTARKLAVKPFNCLVFEDSFVGLLAAKSARMKTIAVPGEIDSGNKNYAIADIRLESLDQFEEKHFDRINAQI